MNYEEKYKEALKVIESLYNVVKYQSSSDALFASQTIEKAFPELRDSEDERIREVLIRGFQHYDKECKWGEFTTTEILSWLEKQGEQKQEENKGNIGGISFNWSEEDEKLYTSALWHIKNSCGNGGKDSGEYEVYNWLKSLKDRVQPQPKLEWNKEDETGWINTKIMIKDYASHHYTKDSVKLVIDWLESIKDRINQSNSGVKRT